MYKTMYQKYQIEDGKLDCEYDYKCPIKYHIPSEQKYSKEKFYNYVYFINCFFRNKRKIPFC